MSTLKSYNYFLISSGAINTNVPQPFTSFSEHNELIPKSIIFTVEKFASSETNMFSNCVTI